MEAKSSSLVDPNQMIVVGNVGAPHGLKGWVRVHSYTEPTENLFHYPDCYIKKDKYTVEEWQKIKIVNYQAHGKCYIALFEGLKDISEAEQITNCQLGIPRSELPDLEPGTYYWTDFIGMTVITETGVTLGVVQGLFETGANDVLVVKDQERERLLPYVLNDVIINIDQKNRRILVNWDPEF